MKFVEGGILLDAETLADAPPNVQSWISSLIFHTPYDFGAQCPTAGETAATTETRSTPASEPAPDESATPSDESSDENATTEEDPFAGMTEEEIKKKKLSDRAKKAARTRAANKAAKLAEQQAAEEAAGGSESPSEGQTTPDEEPVEPTAEATPEPPAEPEQADTTSRPAEADIFSDATPETDGTTPETGHPIDNVDDKDLPGIDIVTKEVRTFLMGNGNDTKPIMDILSKCGKSRVSECTDPKSIRELVKGLSLDV